MSWRKIAKPHPSPPRLAHDVSLTVILPGANEPSKPAQSQRSSLDAVENEPEVLTVSACTVIAGYIARLVESKVAGQKAMLARRH